MQLRWTGATDETYFKGNTNMKWLINVFLTSKNIFSSMSQILQVSQL